MNNTNSGGHHQLYQNLLQNLPGTFFKSTSRPTWMFLYASEKCEALTGYSSSDLVNNAKVSIQSLIHPDDCQQVLLSRRDLLKAQKEIRLEYRIITNTGRHKWVREISNGVYDSSGALIHEEGYLEDVTAAKDTDLISSAFNSYQNAINRSSIVSITDPKGTIIYANDLFCETSKYSRDELIGQNHSLLNSGYHSRRFFSILWKTIVGGQVWRGEVKNKAKDGSYYWVDSTIAPVFDTNGGLTGFLSIRTLITEKVEVRNALKESETFANAIIEAMDSQIAVIDENGTVLTTNKSWERFGQEHTEIKHNRVKKGTNYFNFYALAVECGDAEGDFIFSGLRSILDGEATHFRFEYNCRVEKGDYWFLLKASLLPGPHKRLVVRHIDITESKNYQLALLEQQSALQMIIENVPGAVYTCQLQAPWRVMRMSSAVEEITGWSAASFLRGEINWADIVHPDDLPMVQTRVDAAVSAKSKYRIDYRILDRAGNLRWVYEVGQASYSEKDVPKHLEGNIYDITDRKQTELESKNAHEKFKNIIENIWGVYWVNDPTHKKTLYISPSYSKVWKYPYQELYEDSGAFLKTIHPDDVERIKEGYHAIHRHENQEFRYRIVRGDGEIRWISARIKVSQDEESGELREYGYAVDITEAVEAQNQVKENELYLSAVFDTVNDAIITVTFPERCIVRINKAATEMLGYQESEMIGKTTDFLFPNYEDFLAYGRHMRRSWTDTHHEFNTEIKLKCKDGSLIWCAIQTSELRDQQEDVVKAVSVIHDITDRKERENYLKKLVNDLTYRVNQNLQFNYIVSHNLRAPLSNILGLTDLIGSKDALSDFDQKIVDNIQKSASGIDQTIKDLNEILAVETPKKFMRERLNITQMVLTQLEVIDAEWKQNIELNLSISEEANTMVTVRSFIESIFYNLLSNAFKYRHTERRLALSIIGKANSASVSFEIGDNGIGIDLQKNSGEIFGLYKRFNHDVDGKGLGLHLVKKHIESLGGQIQVESEPDVGTTFKFTLQSNHD